LRIGHGNKCPFRNARIKTATADSQQHGIDAVNGSTAHQPYRRFFFFSAYIIQTLHTPMHLLLKTTTAPKIFKAVIFFLCKILFKILHSLYI